MSGEPVGALTLAVGLVAVVVGFGAWWTYFDFAGGRRPRPERAASVQWMLGHLPLTAASIPWTLAVARRLANGVDSPG